MAEKDRPKLDIIVPGVIIDDIGHTDRRLGLRFGRIFTAQPAHARALFFFISLCVGAIVAVEHMCKIEAADLSLHLACDGKDLCRQRTVKRLTRGHQPFGCKLGLQ